jgi:hypothetical protein
MEGFICVAPSNSICLLGKRRAHQRGATTAHYTTTQLTTAPGRTHIFEGSRVYILFPVSFFVLVVGMGSDDLIDFDIIENQKENIQSLPSGRSAKALAQLFTPPLSSSSGKTPSPAQTQDSNNATRMQFEKELHAIDDSDDPLDIYDRYVKWTLDAYPSAQNTPNSQLCTLLERATKAFQSSTHYKNDPRYLKLWLHYIRFFSDSPRETFAYLAQHNR